MFLFYNREERNNYFTLFIIPSPPASQLRLRLPPNTPLLQTQIILCKQWCEKVLFRYRTNE